MRDDSELTKLVVVRIVRSSSWVAGIPKEYSLWKLVVGWMCGLRNTCNWICCMGNLVEADATR